MYEGSYLTEEYIKEMTKLGEWKNINLYVFLETAAKEIPDEVAIVSYKEEKSSVVRITYREFYEQVNRLASKMAELGIKEGDVVSVQLPNWWEFAVICFATFKLGAVINGLTSIYRQKEISFIMKRTESKIVFIPHNYRNFNYLEMMKELWPSLPNLEKIIVVDGNIEDLDENVIAFNTLLESSNYSNVQFGEVNPNHLVQIAFTSGTTGEPKGVMHTHNTLEATVRNFARHLHLKKGMKNLVISPVGHQTGFLWGTILPVYLQGMIIYLDIWKAQRALEIIKSEQVTNMIAAYPFLHDLANLEDIDEEKPKSLELICIPGAPIPRHMVRYCADRLDCIVAPAWGMTEYGVALAVEPLDPPSAYRTDGKVLNGAHVRVVNESNEKVGIGKEGKLQIKGAGLFIGYYKRPDITKAEFTEDGWFQTGDLAIQNEKGFISITGRSKDIIIRGGENIPVVEIENMLLEWDKVDDVAVVAMPDERLGERACAYIVPKGERFTLRELTEYLMDRGIAKQKLPERIEFIDKLPRTASGKVMKYVLRNDIKTKLENEKLNTSS